MWADWWAGQLFIVFKSDDLLVVLADRLERVIMISWTTWVINRDWSKPAWTINCD
jgi:hypothetical protein